MILRARAEGSGSAAEASRIILDPKSLPKWFSRVQSVAADKSYPREGSHVRWTVGRGGKWSFDAEVVENALPEEFVQQVKTPSGVSRVVHAFEDLAGDRFRYTKTVEPTLRGASRWLSPLVRVVIGSAMRGEVRRAVALVSAEGPEATTRR